MLSGRVAVAARRDSLEARRHSRAETGAVSRSGVWASTLSPEKNGNFGNIDLLLFDARRGSTALTEQAIPEHVELLSATSLATRRKSAADLENRQQSEHLDQFYRTESYALYFVSSLKALL